MCEHLWAAVRTRLDQPDGHALKITFQCDWCGQFTTDIIEDGKLIQEDVYNDL